MQLSWLEQRAADEAAPTTTDLARVDVFYERLEVEDERFQPAVDRIKQARGYVTQDIIELHPETPNLDGICAKFKDEHLHTDDEVRLVLDGEGIFDIRGADDRWIRVQVERGDLLIVPAQLYHRFFLTERKHIRCVRLFKDASGWTPHYR
ncbi:MAG: cupin domain-containing protein [Myxococcales bacterium]|nr:cupin domain-containing protein [Myxococcales bacterium]MCB9752209.1 cupin domain-containing protein [Myxococcales bacterium]